MKNQKPLPQRKVKQIKQAKSKKKTGWYKLKCGGDGSLFIDSIYFQVEMLMKTKQQHISSWETQDRKQRLKFSYWLYMMKACLPKTTWLRFYRMVLAGNVDFWGIFHETINHLISRYPVLTLHKYKYHYDRVEQLLHWKICKR